MFHKKRKTGVSQNTEENTPAGSGNVSEDKSSGKTHKKRRGKIFAVIIAVALVASGGAIWYSVSGNQGLRKSQKLAKKIGEPLEKAGSSAGVELTGSSDFEYINELCTFTSLTESGRQTHVYNVSLPEWTIYCSENSFGKLESVTYCDFRALSSNINGEKKSSAIDVSPITPGSSSSEVDAVLKMKPYQIVYAGTTTSKKYRYYYKNKQSGAVKAYIITVIFGSDGKVNSPAVVESSNFILDVLRVESD